MHVLIFSNSERAPRESVGRPSHAAHLHGAYLAVIIRAARGDQAVFARKLVKTLSAFFHRGHYRRDLFDITDKSRESIAQHLFRHTGRIAFTDHIAVHVLRIGLFAERDWVKVTAVVEKEYFADYEGEGPVLHATSVTKAKQPKEPVISFV